MENIDNYEMNALETLYEEMYRYMIEKDTINLSKILDDDFVLIHMTGMKQNKGEYLEYIKKGRLRYYTAETDHVFFDMKDEHVKLIGQSKVNASVFGGERHTWNLQLTIDLKYVENRWLMAKAVAATY